jgi:hypothetical protein
MLKFGQGRREWLVFPEDQESGTARPVRFVKKRSAPASCDREARVASGIATPTGTDVFPKPILRVTLRGTPIPGQAHGPFINFPPRLWEATEAEGALAVWSAAGRSTP